MASVEQIKAKRAGIGLRACDVNPYFGESRSGLSNRVFFRAYRYSGEEIARARAMAAAQ